LSRPRRGDEHLGAGETSPARAGPCLDLLGVGRGHLGLERGGAFFEAFDFGGDGLAAALAGVETVDGVFDFFERVLPERQLALNFRLLGFDKQVFEVGDDGLDLSRDDGGFGADRGETGLGLFGGFAAFRAGGFALGDHFLSLFLRQHFGLLSWVGRRCVFD
jgi:hypothetical protein